MKNKNLLFSRRPDTSLARVTALLLISFFALDFFRATILHAARWMIVNDDVADVRTNPVAGAFSYNHDPEQETQVLKNEWVRVLKIRGGWADVRCVEQMEFTHHNQFWEALSRLGQAQRARENVPEKTAVA